MRFLGTRRTLYFPFIGYLLPPRFVSDAHPVSWKKREKSQRVVKATLPSYPHVATGVGGHIVNLGSELRSSLQFMKGLQPCVSVPSCLLSGGFEGLSLSLSFYRDIPTTALTMTLHQADRLEGCPAFLGPEATEELLWIPSKHRAPSCRLSSTTNTSTDRVRNTVPRYHIHSRISMPYLHLPTSPLPTIFGGLDLKRALCPKHIRQSQEHHLSSSLQATVDKRPQELSGFP